MVYYKLILFYLMFMAINFNITGQHQHRTNESGTLGVTLPGFDFYGRLMKSLSKYFVIFIKIQIYLGVHQWHTISLKFCFICLRSGLTNPLLLAEI